MLWKNGAKAAFALGFDLDGATIWRNKAERLPGGSAFIKGPSIGEYGLKVGAHRVMEILDEYDIKATWFIPAENIIRYPQLVEKILDHGHEITNHDYDHRGEFGATPEEQIETFEKCQEVFVKYTGLRAYGFRATGSVMEETRKWMYTDGGFLYESSEHSGDKCCYIDFDGAATPAVNIPCRDQMMDDYMQTVMNNYPQVLVNMPRIAPYKNAYRNWIRELEAMVRYGGVGSPAFHPQISGSPGRSMMLEKLCQYLADHKNEIWTTTCLDIARYYKEQMEGEDPFCGEPYAELTVTYSGDGSSDLANSGNPDGGEKDA